jgi:hypothetical protein
MLYGTHLGCEPAGINAGLPLDAHYEVKVSSMNLACAL